MKFSLKYWKEMQGKLTGFPVAGDIDSIYPNSRKLGFAKTQQTSFQ